MKAVYLFADSTPGHGLGHIKRCEVLFHLLMKNNVDIHYIKFNKNDSLVLINNSLVIIDSHQDFSLIVNQFKENNNTVIVLDNFFADQRDLSINVFNHSLGINKTVVGYQNMIIRETVLQQKNQHLPVEDYALVTIGGEDSQGLGEQIALEVKNHFQKVIIVYGPLAKMEKKLDGVIQLQNPLNYIELMIKSRIIFCNAGTTLFESVLLNKTCIAIPQSIFEENIAQDFLNKKYILSIGLNNIKEPLSQLESFSVPPICFKGNGAEEISKHIKEYL